MTRTPAPRRAHTVRRLAGLVATCGLALGAPGVAHATTSVTSGLLKCSVTAMPPVLVGSGSSGMLTGWAAVTCNRVTSIQVVVGVVELDGTVEDPKVPVPPTTKSVSIASSQVNKVVLVSTGTVKCLDTDLLAKEEYASKAMLNLFGPTSAWDRTVPRNDSYAC